MASGARWPPRVAFHHEFAALRDGVGGGVSGRCGAFRIFGFEWMAFWGPRPAKPATGLVGVLAHESQIGRDPDYLGFRKHGFLA